MVTGSMQEIPLPGGTEGVKLSGADWQRLPADDTLEKPGRCRVPKVQSPSGLISQAKGQSQVRPGRGLRLSVC